MVHPFSVEGVVKARRERERRRSFGGDRDQRPAKRGAQTVQFLFAERSTAAARIEELAELRFGEARSARELALTAAPRLFDPRPAKFPCSVALGNVGPGGGPPMVYYE